ncbi:hypothetical protein JZI27_18250, partial [Brevibacillus sp. AY1]|nr:hypothetical protein [Brevibacillus sp. AY1]
GEVLLFLCSKNLEPVGLRFMKLIHVIEDRQTYVIRGNEWQEVANHDLPIEGYVITSCAKGEADAMSSGCENLVEYLFDARKN